MSREGIVRSAWRALLVLGLLGGMLFVSGCGSSGPQAGFRESDRNGRWQATFGVWDGSESHDLGVEDERSLLLSYFTEIDEGSVTFVLRAPSGESVWTLSQDGHSEDRDEIALGEDGDYTLTAYGDDATGEFVFSWETR